ncbi:MAG: hypothetical protein AAGJ94_16610, partial [Pseudomonadota bacterium]
MTIRAESTIDDLTQRAEGFRERIEFLHSAIGQTLQDRGGDLATRIEGTADRIEKAISTEGGALDETLRTSTETIKYGLVEQTENARLVFADAAGTFSDAMRSHSDEVTQTLRLAGSEIATAVTTEMAAATEEINKSATTVAEIIADRGDAIRINLDQEAIALSARVDTIREQISSDLASLSSIIDERAMPVTTTLSTAIDRYDELVTSRTAEVVEALTNHATDVTAVLTERMDAMDSALDGRVENVSKALVERARAISTTLAEGQSMINDAFAARIAEVNTLTEDAVGTVSREIQSEGTQAQEALRAAIDNARQDVLTPMHDLSVQLSEETAAVQGMLAETMSSMTGEVASSGKLMEGAMVEALDRILTLIDERTEATRQQIEETMKLAHESLAHESARTVQSMEGVARDTAASLSDLKVAIDEHGDQFLTALADRGGSAIAQLRDTHRALVDELGGTLARVEETNEALHQMLGSVGATLADMETNLSNRGEDLKGVLERSLAETDRTAQEMTRQAANLRESSDTALKELATIAERIESDSNQLATSVYQFNSDTEAFDERMAARRAGLDELSAALTQKSQHLDEMIRGFSERADEQLRNAEHRAHDARMLLERTLEDASRAVAPQLEAFHEAANADAERIRESLRLSNEAMASDMVDALKTVSSRFADATSDMRDSARVVQEEFEATRTALERSVLELPEATLQNAEALRRAVSNQLDAVRELGAIVARHTGAGEPIEVAPEPRGAGRLRERSLDRHSDTRDAPLNGGARHSGDDGGWSNGRLRRADTDDRGSTAGDGVARLSRSAAKAIEDGVYRDIWARHHRGERQIFSRQLYTLDGQQTFEDVRRRYQRDREFRGDVDRYVDEFEELITDTSREDSSGRRTRDTLMSDDGKLYTLLAHASGRLA